MANNRFMSSSNPFVSQSRFSQSAKNSAGITHSGSGSELMTVQGAVNKSLLLTGILIASAIILPMILGISKPMIYGSMFVGLGLVLASYFKPTWAPITAPLYAVVEGLFVGSVSYLFAEFIDPSIVMNAVLLTALCLGSMLVAYKTGLIKPTEKFRSMIMTATGAIMLIYALSFILGMFGVDIPYLHEGGAIGIGISIFIIGIATLNLILDFDNIDRGARAGAPKYMEWVCSLGLLVTLVWIYIEILRLLAVIAANSGD